MSTTISGTNGVTFPDSTSMQTGQQACKAWVNFNGTGTVAIRGSYNVSSITDNGTGNYTLNFTTSMPDANYTAAMNILEGAVRLFYVGTLSISSIRVICVNTASTPTDNAAIGVSVFSN